MYLEEIDNKALKYGLHMRLVNENDAGKIILLRTDSRLSKHIHSTDKLLENQISYIKNYKLRESAGIEYYFAFSLTENTEPIGFYRIYNIDFENKTFTIGSWVFEQNIPENIPILSDILVKEFGFDLLKLKTCFFDVRSKNKKVFKYHMLFSPVFIREDEEENNFFYLSKENFEENKKIIFKFLI